MAKQSRVSAPTQLLGYITVREQRRHAHITHPVVDLKAGKNWDIVKGNCRLLQFESTVSPTDVFEMLAPQPVVLLWRLQNLQLAEVVSLEVPGRGSLRSAPGSPFVFLLSGLP